MKKLKKKKEKKLITLCLLTKNKEQRNKLFVSWHICLFETNAAGTSCVYYSICEFMVLQLSSPFSCYCSKESKKKVCIHHKVDKRLSVCLSSIVPLAGWVYKSWCLCVWLYFLFLINRTFGWLSLLIVISVRLSIVSFLTQPFFWLVESISCDVCVSVYSFFVLFNSQGTITSWKIP